MARIKYSIGFKLEVIQYHLNNDCGRRRVANHFNLHEGVVRKWIDIYNIHGKEGFEPTPNKSYSFNFKKEVVLTIIEEGLSFTDALYRFKLREVGMLSTWLRQYKEHGIDGLKSKPRGRHKAMPKPQPPKACPNNDSDKTQAELLEELAYLRAENAFLKKLKALRLEQEAKAAAEQQRLQGLYQD